MPKHNLILNLPGFTLDGVSLAQSEKNIVTYEMNELMATKLRALYQRRKGRGLSNLWYVTDRNLINLNQIFDIFSKYCTYNDVKVTGAKFLKNFELKIGLTPACILY